MAPPGADNADDGGRSACERAHHLSLSRHIWCTLRVTERLRRCPPPWRGRIVAGPHTTSEWRNRQTRQVEGLVPE